MLPTSFLDQTSNWICSKCDSSVPSYHVQEIIDQIGQELHELPKGNSKAAKDFIKIYEKYLHSNHYYLTDVRFALTQLLGHENEKQLPGLSDEDLEYKARLCQAVSDLVKTIAPGNLCTKCIKYCNNGTVLGETRMRGLLMFELHATVAELGRRNPDPQQLVLTLLVIINRFNRFFLINLRIF